MKDIWIIIVPQEYESANHKYLWLSLAKKLSDTSDVIILNIPSDFLVTFIKKKYYRFREAKKGIIKLTNNLYVIRPVMILRPEISPGFINKINGIILRKQLSEYIADFKIRNKNILIYDGSWIGLLSQLGESTRIMYYILDEVKLYANTGRSNVKQARFDLIGCQNADIIFTISEKIFEKRGKFANKVVNVGNGAMKSDISNSTTKIKKSVGIVGSIRNWIDFDMLEMLIETKKDILFCFAGPIEDNVRDVFNNILNNYCNTAYFGVYSKETVSYMYKMIEVTIVPYINNEFIRSSRPIKIVESVFAGTPVVTVPVNGYEQCPFIRFASTVDEFSREIEYLMKNPLDQESIEYKQFIKENSWDAKSQIIINALSLLD